MNSQAKIGHINLAHFIDKDTGRTCDTYKENFTINHIVIKYLKHTEAPARKTFTNPTSLTRT